MYGSMTKTGNYYLVRKMPGFGPAAALVAWRVSKGATFVVEAKVDKTIYTPPGHIRVDGRKP